MSYYQEILVEFKVTGVLSGELVDTVKPLEEDRTLLVGVVRRQTTPLTELVTEAKPLPLNKHPETLFGNINSQCNNHTLKCTP